MKRNGILTINQIPYQTEIKELEDLGELGNGTSGHVVKMRHGATSKIIAVKVSELCIFFFFLFHKVLNKFYYQLHRIPIYSKCVELATTKKINEF